MEPMMQRESDDRQVPLFDPQGHVIGVISRPVEPEVLGPGRETVYLMRRPSSPRVAAAAPRTSHAA